MLSLAPTLNFFFCMVDVAEEGGNDPLSSHQPRHLGITPSTTRYIYFLENEARTCTTREAEVGEEKRVRGVGQEPSQMPH